ncbi:prolactin-releasing peptide-like [Mobula hypostoma]|uniref:prolactin-releasing peptide-like n=1 Tax=Mobula hypostoma TaxID=723540 RepID=UPI002FC287C7
MQSGAFCGPSSFLNQQQGVQKKVQLITICILLLVVSMCASTAQSRGLTHHIDNRNSNIDPYWYVDRGVRPIGRFGKRQMTSSSNARPADNLALILNMLREQNAVESNRKQDGELMY